MQVIVMGVSGSGKSYLAERLVSATGWAFAEGDDFHTPDNKARMAAGVAMTDAERKPWLDALHAVLMQWSQTGVNGVMTCSALKEIYRERLMEGLRDLRFVWLDPPRPVLEQRMAHRKGHYMPAALLDSQIATLERPTESKHVLRLDGTQVAQDEIKTVLAWLKV
ncbi:MAG TPA: gluconokinase [Acidobacteriaceae bacterium]|nr:gluconokinase [Acidobacteriaceae bacterium]